MTVHTAGGARIISPDFGEILRHLPEMENSSVDDYLEYYFQCTRNYGDAFRSGTGIFACIECGEEFRKMWKHPITGEERMVTHLREQHNVNELTTSRESNALLSKLEWKRLGDSTIYVCSHCSDFSTSLTEDRGTTMEVDNEIIEHMENLHHQEWKHTSTDHYSRTIRLRSSARIQEPCPTLQRFAEG